MRWNGEAEEIMRERFGGDNEMALATCRDNVPSVRTVNAAYREGCFYIITYALSRKMEDIRVNPVVASLGNGSPATARRRAWGGLAGRKTGRWPPTCVKYSPDGLRTATTTFPITTPSSCGCE